MGSEQPSVTRVPTVRAPVVPLVIDRDTIQFRVGPWAGGAWTIVDHEGEGHLADLLPLLDGTHTEQEILESFQPHNRTEVQEVIDRLYENGVLIDAQDRDHVELGGYLTHPGRWTEPPRARLPDATVVVVNAGQIGRMVLEDLVSMDITTTLLRHPNTPEPDVPSSVRQAITILESMDELSETIETADAVIYTADTPTPSVPRRINRLALDTSTPWILGRIQGADGIVGPTVIPRQSSCYQCFRLRATANLAGPLNLETLENATTQRARDPPASFARVIAGYLTIDVAHLLQGATAFTVGRIIRFNFFDLSVESNAVLKVPRCPDCGLDTRETIDWQRFVTLEQLLAGDSQ